MVKGTKGLYLEAYKFGIYVGIPILATFYFADPIRQKRSADYWQYVKYPANPNVGMKEQLQKLREQREQQKEYRQKLVELNEQAQRTTDATSDGSKKER